MAATQVRTLRIDFTSQDQTLDTLTIIFNLDQGLELTQNIARQYMSQWELNEAVYGKTFPASMDAPKPDWERRLAVAVAEQMWDRPITVVTKGEHNG